MSAAAEDHNLAGREIVAVRQLTDRERDTLAWFGSGIVLELDDGSLLVPSRDPEGNGPGAVFHWSAENAGVRTLGTVRGR